MDLGDLINAEGVIASLPAKSKKQVLQALSAHAAGLTGATGATGSDGKDGTEGSKGDPGTPGKDAPVIVSAVCNSEDKIVLGLSNGTTVTVADSDCRVSELEPPTEEPL